MFEIRCDVNSWLTQVELRHNPWLCVVFCHKWNYLYITIIEANDNISIDRGWTCHFLCFLLFIDHFTPTLTLHLIFTITQNTINLPLLIIMIPPLSPTPLLFILKRPNRTDQLPAPSKINLLDNLGNMKYLNIAQLTICGINENICLWKNIPNIFL